MFTTNAFSRHAFSLDAFSLDAFSLRALSQASRPAFLVAAIVTAFVWSVAPAAAKAYLVKDQDAYAEAVKRLKPGDTVVLANGEWRDFEIVFEAYGKKDQPITLIAETPGEVIISGRSNLRIGGDHLVVHGLIFRDGYSPTKEVIAFRRDSKTLASNTRLSEVVIDGFNKPDRADQDNWIVLFGRNNRIDHSYFAGKTNRGPTLVVRLNTEASRQNQHTIDHNYFGYRPSLGGNGGETIRIGVSGTSRTQSQTIIARNFFERCDGEVEIISIKSEGNTVAENVFYESRGAVVFRHGGNNEVYRNVFLGNGAPDTGGVRVINENQTVRDNYFEGLRGEKFLSALTIMNGVPNSPINRYHQVKNARVANNSFLDIASIGLAVGSDEERSATPVDSVVSKNLFVSASPSPVSVFDDISGIRFAENVTNNPALSDIASTVKPALKLVRAENGLLYPDDEALSEVGAPRDLDPVKRKKTGPTWFDKPAVGETSAKARKVKRGGGALAAALAEAPDGAVLKLSSGRYALDGPLAIDRAITIRGPRRGKPAILSASGASVFSLLAGGRLTLSNVNLVASAENKAIIAARGETYKGAYELSVKNTAFAMGEASAAIPAIMADPATFAEAISLADVSVKDWKGAFVALSGAGLDGYYLADDIAINNSTFENVGGPLISFGREGRDESTFGPRFNLVSSTLDNVNPDAVAIDLDGIDGVRIEGNTVSNSGEIKIRKRVLGLQFAIAGNRLENSGGAILTGVDGEPLDVGAAGFTNSKASQ